MTKKINTSPITAELVEQAIRAAEAGHCVIGGVDIEYDQGAYGGDDEPTCYTCCCVGGFVAQLSGRRMPMDDIVSEIAALGPGHALAASLMHEVDPRVLPAIAAAARGESIDRVEQIMRDAGMHVVGPDETVRIEGGFWYVLRGSPTITQSGGEITTYGASSPTITQSGGDVVTYGASSPTITQSVGRVVAYDTSSPTITQTGGQIWTCDASSPTITRIESAV